LDMWKDHFPETARQVFSKILLADMSEREDTGVDRINEEDTMSMKSVGGRRYSSTSVSASRTNFSYPAFQPTDDSRGPIPPLEKTDDAQEVQQGTVLGSDRPQRTRRRPKRLDD
jgi:hypothetical protein